MIPQQNISITRTEGDEVPILLQLSRLSDSGTTVVPDDATVYLDIKDGSSTVSILGTARGDASGTFLFSPTTLPAGQSLLPFDVRVIEDSVTATLGSGVINVLPDI